MRKFTLSVLLLIGVWAAAGEAAKDRTPALRFVASKKSDVYHVPRCKSVEQILAANRIEFPTREDAEKAGKRACKICKP